MRNKVLPLLIVFLLISSAAMGQGAFAIKKWKGRYPRMNNDYPLAFVSWKGWLPPVPHFFVRLYPSHYYYYLTSLPVIDAKSYLDMGLYGGLKMVLKNIDKDALYQSLQAIEGTQLNQMAHEEIAAFMRQSRLVSMPDIYQTSLCFDKAIQALHDLKQQDAPSAIHAGFEQDIRHYLEELLMINQLDARQGDKLQAMAELNRNVQQLTGTIHYTTHKIRACQHCNEEWPSNLGFLGKL
ncbi:hypothetical protein KEM09_04815 [Carboxylicivirga mesophila]|uniref:DUF5667 domain-containing protein n=1 Tax=Carboxylicivirga mesophila TaxID=1166478 RepID=A0ABS5K6U5_9BACT|nr:hypothetical protein [Carboxylicivirga mesophila]MBS2210710.1 hypothetical protein [Carboxylicivirga mesophila]